MHTFTELCCLLQTQQAKKIYLIHEPKRASEVREFAEKLREKGFKPLIGADFRPAGKKAVSLAIASSDLSLIVAFDDETVEKAQKLGVHCFRIVEETTI